MFEYKVEKCKVNDAEELMNRYAKGGWRVVAQSPNTAMGYGLFVTFERGKNKI